MKAVTHLEKVIAGETSAVTHLEKVIAGETTAVTYTEKVIAGEAPPITHLQKVIAGEARPVTHLEYVWAGGSPPSVQEYTGAVPVTFIADGTPLIDLLISGNEEHSGTPTPTTPIQPSECEERTGNLFNKNSATANKYIDDADGEIKNLSNNYASDYINIQGLEYIFPSSATKSQWGAFYDANKDFISGIRGYGVAIQVPQNAVYARLTVHTDYIDTFMLNLGSTPLPYEPYGIKIPISSANATTPVYLGEVETTRKIKKYEVTGQENWFLSTAQTGRFGLSLSDYLKATGVITSYCSHYEAVAQKTSGTAPNNSQYFYSGSDTARYLFIVDTSCSTAADFKTYLQQQYAAGTPVTVWYVLATPETAVVNEPLMKIGDYADTLSYAQAGVQIPTANGSTTLDVETTVKPSEVYIKFRGEAVAALSALPAEVSSPGATTEEENPEETEEEENGSEDVSLQHEFEAIE